MKPKLTKGIHIAGTPHLRIWAINRSESLKNTLSIIKYAEMTPKIKNAILSDFSSHSVPSFSIVAPLAQIKIWYPDVSLFF